MEMMMDDFLQGIEVGTNDNKKQNKSKLTHDLNDVQHKILKDHSVRVGSTLYKVIEIVFRGLVASKNAFRISRKTIANRLGKNTATISRAFAVIRQYVEIEQVRCQNGDYASLTFKCNTIMQHHRNEETQVYQGIESDFSNSPSSFNYPLEVCEESFNSLENETEVTEDEAVSVSTKEQKNISSRHFRDFCHLLKQKYNKKGMYVKQDKFMQLIEKAEQRGLESATYFMHSLENWYQNQMRKRGRKAVPVTATTEVFRYNWLEDGTEQEVEQEVKNVDDMSWEEFKAHFSN